MEAANPPVRGPAQYIQWFFQFQFHKAGAKLLAGFILAPVKASPANNRQNTVKPIFKGAESCSFLFLGSHTPQIADTNAKVNKNSMKKLCDVDKSLCGRFMQIFVPFVKKDFGESAIRVPYPTEAPRH